MKENFTKCLLCFDTYLPLLGSYLYRSYIAISKSADLQLILKTKKFIKILVQPHPQQKLESAYIVLWSKKPRGRDLRIF